MVVPCSETMYRRPHLQTFIFILSKSISCAYLLYGRYQCVSSVSQQLNQYTPVCLFKRWGYTLVCSNTAGKQHWLNRFPAAGDRWWTPAKPDRAVCTVEPHSIPQYEVVEDSLTKSQAVGDTWKEKRENSCKWQQNTGSFYLIRSNKHQNNKTFSGYFRRTVWIYYEGPVANTTVDGAFDKSTC